MTQKGKKTFDGLLCDILLSDTGGITLEIQAGFLITQIKQIGGRVLDNVKEER